MRKTILLLSTMSLLFISGTIKPGSAPASPIDGEWELVWYKMNGKVTSTGKPLQFKMFHNGFFSTIMQDSTGKWTIAAAGIFETTGNTYKETFRYCSLPNFIGYSDWQEFVIKGDTLYNKLFTKVTDPSGKEETGWVKGMEEKKGESKTITREPQPTNAWL